MHTTNILNEVGEILRSNHPAYTGDNVRNAEGFLWGFANDFPESAKEIGRDIAKNLNAASELSGLHPVRCQWIAHILTKRF